MKNIMKKLTSVFLVLVMALTIIPAAVVDAAPTVPKSKVLYKGSVYDTTVNYSLYDLTKSQKISKSTVKSSKPSVAQVSSVSHSTNKSENYSYETKKTTNNTTYSASINLKAKKAGTTTLTFKLGSKKYSSKITVKNYVNPASSVKVTGISSNLATKAKKTSDVKAALNKTTKNGIIKITAKSGWKIQNVDFSNNTNYSSYSYYAYSKPVSSATLRVGTITGKKPYSVYVTFINTKDGGTITQNYRINSPY